MDVKKMAQDVLPEVIHLRRELHRFPEASMQEFRTTERLMQEMEALGLSCHRFEPTGLMADLHGSAPGPLVVLRADIDALSITEKTDVEFASEVEGMMHACGHDTHAAMLFGAARVLSQCRDAFCGTVRFLFQPAEEIGRGARLVLEQGALNQAQMIFGVHVVPMVPPGAVAWSEGVSNAAADTFYIKVIGKACHGAMPETGADATVAAAAVVMALQTAVSRFLSPLEPVVLTIGKLVSGTRFNIVSGEAQMEGTIRYFSQEIREQLPRLMERLAKETAAAYGCQAEIEFVPMVNFLQHAPEAVAIARKAALEITPAPQLVVQMNQKMMASEDFSEYTSYCPAAFVMLGAGGEYPSHSDHFFVEEQALATGTAFYAQVALEALQALKQ